jgi:signal transduction histidine kinase
MKWFGLFQGIQPERGRKAPDPTAPPRSRRLFKGMLLGFLTGLLGVAFTFTYLGRDLEEEIGLRLLFTLRWKRPPPPEVVVVSIDAASSGRLGLPLDSRDWPRSVHARLVRKLAEDGARLVVFDLTFDEARPKEDPIFADEIRAAGNVLLLGHLKREGVPLSDPSGRVRSEVVLEKMIPPAPDLAREARSFSPFPLPKVPVTVSQFWTFKEGAGDLPTLPVTAFQLYAMSAQDDLVRLLRKALEDPTPAEAESPIGRVARLEAERVVALPKEEIKGAEEVGRLIGSLKRIFRHDTPISNGVRRALSNPATGVPPEKAALLKAVIGMYENGDSRYLNFYGPAQTITTVPYFEALASDLPEKKRADFKGKVVFVGVSDLYPNKPGDTYHTFFSRSNGIDLSGVEIAATAFANLRERNSVRPVGAYPFIATVLLFGFVVGIISLALRPLPLMGCSVGLILLYLGVVYAQFASAALWFPLVVPLAVQGPFAFLAALLWRHLDARKLEAAHAQLKELDRVKSMFLSHVSHELKTPLSAIKGFIDNMIDGVTGDLQGKQREYLNRIQANTARLSRMITNLLDLSRIEAGTQQFERVPLRLYELAEEVTELFRFSAAEKRLILELVCHDPAVKVLGDRDKLIQVITNLIDNALKFTPAGGKVTIAVGRSGPDEARLVVADTGEGIPSDALTKLFEPFYQASRKPGAKSKGLGLGLSIVKTLVELHGGTISVTSEVGRGTEFCIRVPLLSEKEA